MGKGDQTILHMQREVYTRPRLNQDHIASMPTFWVHLKDHSCSPQWIKSSSIISSKDIKQGQLPSRSYKSTVMLDSTLPQGKIVLQLQFVAFLGDRTTMLVSFTKHGFLSFGSFTVATWLQHHWIRLTCWTLSFLKCLKSSPFLGLRLPGPLLSPAKTQVVDYPLANS